MKFITELDLRDLYRAKPFTTYVLESHQKITPSARQFLADKKIKLVQAQDGGKSSANLVQTIQGRQSWCALRLKSRMDRLESLFLLVGTDLLSCGDSILAEEVMELGKCFQNLSKAEQQQIAPAAIRFGEWSEEQIKGCAVSLGENFEIRECHLRLKNGKAIALLNYLRASLSELEPLILEAYWNEEQQICLREDLREKVNLTINILRITMWKCLGGQKCQQ